MQLQELYGITDILSLIIYSIKCYYSTKHCCSVIIAVLGVARVISNYCSIQGCSVVTTILSVAAVLLLQYYVLR